jgi:high-affinity Fe2+/Pb2+ permease
MNQIEFYSKAQFDVRFRRQKIGEARYEKRIATGFAVSVATGWFVYLAYAEIAGIRFPEISGLLVLMVLCASLYSQARLRLAALLAMESKEPNPARPEAIL